MVDIPALNALIKERGLCARSSRAASESRSNASLGMGTADQQHYAVSCWFIHLSPRQVLNIKEL